MKNIEAPGFALPGVEDITRRDFLVGGAGLLALGIAGCGGDGGDGASRETRRVQSPMGPVELPVDLRRLVAMYAVDVDVALVLDLPLVGAPGARGLASQAFASYQPEEELEDVQKITTFPEANYEQIAALGPDCILDSTTDDEQQYERLSEIAPTFNYNKSLYKGENYTADWKDGLRSVARAFERESHAEEVIAEYEERATDLRERVAERYLDATFATIGGFEPGTILVTDTHQQPARILMNDLGLTPSDAMPETFEGRPNLSLERLDLLADADLLFVRVEPAQEGEGRDRSVLDPIQDSQLWQRLPAVRKGRVVEYDAELFYASPLTAETFLDVVERSLLS